MLDTIKKTEKDAEELEKEASLKSNTIIQNAKEKSKKILDDSIIEAQQLSEEIIKKSEADADLEISNMLEKLKIDSLQLKEKVNDKLDSVADTILGRIVKAHGNN